MKSIYRSPENFRESDMPERKLPFWKITEPGAVLNLRFPALFGKSRNVLVRKLT